MTAAPAVTPESSIYVTLWSTCCERIPNHMNFSKKCAPLLLLASVPAHSQAQPLWWLCGSRIFALPLDSLPYDYVLRFIWNERYYRKVGPKVCLCHKLL